MSPARINAVMISSEDLKSKDRSLLVKSFFARKDKAVASGLYSKGTDAQTHTPSASILHTFTIWRNGSAVVMETKGFRFES